MLFDILDIDLSSCSLLMLLLLLFEEGLLDLGTFDTSLVGSKLRNAGWAGNEAPAQ